MKFYKYIQVLSLDVVAGSCISTLYIAKLFNTTIPALSVVALGISVWLIYTADHLWDARKNDKPSTFRHSFHQKNFKLIATIWVLIAALGIAILFFLPVDILKYGGILLVAVLIYFLLLHILRTKRIMHKEISIAFIYSAGIFVAPLAMVNDENIFAWEWFFLLYFSLALINVFLFAMYEEAIDKEDGHHSIVTVMGNVMVMRLSKLLWISGILILAIIGRDFSMHYIFIVMFFLLGSLFAFQDFYSENERYRIVGDGIFMLPIIPLLL